MEERKKRRQFSLEEKREMLTAIDGGMKKSEVAKRNGINPSTLSTILKDKERILKSTEMFGPNRKKIRGSRNEDVDKAVHDWFMEARAKNIPITGPVLCEKARCFARSYGLMEFKGSSGWLQRFRSRYNIRSSNRRLKNESLLSISQSPNCSTSQCVPERTYAMQSSIDENKAIERLMATTTARLTATAADMPQALNMTKELLEVVAAKGAANDCDDDENIVTLPEAKTMSQHLHRFLMAEKDVPEIVLSSSEILQDYLEKLVLEKTLQQMILDLFKQ